MVFREVPVMIGLDGRHVVRLSALVTVTSTQLVVRLGIPNSVLFFFGAFARDIVVPRSTIRSVRYGRWFIPWIRVVEVIYEDEHRTKSMTLWSNEPDKLLLKLSNISDD
jgi:hypothetical protein